MASPRRVQGFGWRRQLPDHRDYLYHERNDVLEASRVPSTGGLTPDELPPIWDQAQLGSCVPHGSVRTFLTEAMKQGISVPMLSRLWVYAKGRELEGTALSEDSGMEVRDAVRVLAEVGAPPETDWPYTDANPGPFQQEPPATLANEALQNMAVTYQSVQVNVPGAPMRTALSNKQAIVFGFPVPDYFEGGWDPASEEPLPLPQPDTNYIGGHCVVVTSYNFTGKFVSGPFVSRSVPPYFTCDNSWSESWGMAGRFNIHYKWFSQGATDLWVMQKVS